MRVPDSIEIKNIKLKNVPCLLLRPKSAKGKLPTLFHYHGWGSNKGRQQFFGATICQYGYQVILPDSNYHGDRSPLSDYSSQNLIEYFPKVILQAVEEFTEIRKEAEELYEVDQDRIAVSGHSMGGFIASSIFARNEGLKVLVCINGASSWEKAVVMLEDYMNELGKEHNIYKEELKEFEPLTYRDKFYPRPILMLHGDSDTSVPIDIQRYFYEEVHSLYKADPERLQLEEYRNMNHHISIRMVESTVKWLDQYL